MLALPFVLLGGAELALRRAGYGRIVEPLFIASPQQPGYLQANPRVVTRFFTDPTQAPSVSIETAYFRRQKPAGTFRVFVQGESSAAGFPYGLGASLAGVLDQRLERAFPSREIEVISTAMAAVNSYALVDFADEIIAQQPDAVIDLRGPQRVPRHPRRRLEHAACGDAWHHPRVPRGAGLATVPGDEPGLCAAASGRGRGRPARPATR